MNLRASTRLGMFGMAMPLFEVVTRIVWATIAGIPAQAITAGWDFAAMARAELPGLTVLAFLYVLYRSSARATSPARLSDAAMGASIVLILALAWNLRWSIFVVPFHDMRGVGWIQVGSAIIGHVLEPFAWLAFLVTFVRLPEPPLQPASRRAALLVAAAVLAGGALTMATMVIQYMVMAGFRGGYPDWNFTMVGLLNLLRCVLLVVFAVGAWRARPQIDPAGRAW